MKWQDKLKKSEMAHIRWTCNGKPSLIKFAAIRQEQKMMKKQSLKLGVPLGMAEPCWECRMIAEKLGFK